MMKNMQQGRTSDGSSGVWQLILALVILTSLKMSYAVYLLVSLDMTGFMVSNENDIPVTAQACGGVKTIVECS